MDTVITEENVRHGRYTRPEIFRRLNYEKDISENQEDDMGRDQKPQAPESWTDNGILQSADTAVSRIFRYCRDLPEREQFDDTDSQFRY
jgi:hypothetical protein